MAKEDRKVRTQLMLSPSVIAYLDAASKNTNLSKSALLELCVRREMDKEKPGESGSEGKTSRN